MRIRSRSAVCILAPSLSVGVRRTKDDCGKGRKDLLLREQFDAANVITHPADRSLNTTFPQTTALPGGIGDPMIAAACRYAAKTIDRAGRFGPGRWTTVS